MIFFIDFFSITKKVWSAIKLEFWTLLEDFYPVILSNP